MQHRSKKQSVSLISPNHFIHIPRHFFQGNYDIPAILRSGLRVQVRGVQEGSRAVQLRVQAARLTLRLCPCVDFHYLFCTVYTVHMGVVHQ